MTMASAVLHLMAGWVATQMDGSIVAGERAREFTDVSIDSRTVKAGELYVGIRGERFDGAEFASAAIEAGAAGVVVPRGWSANASAERDAVTGSAKALAERSGSTGSANALAERGVVVIEVDDTTAALQALAHGVRREAGTTVVAITGSAGKTTTKEVTSEFLETRYRVVRNRGNFNNHIGLPLSLIELRLRPEVAVVELGMNHAGEISTLVRVAEPDVRVWTNVGEAHLGFFASIDAIADAKAEILERADASTLLVANADDPRISARIGAFPGRVVTFGIDSDADVRARDVVDRGIEGTSARVSARSGVVEISTPLVGKAQLANIRAPRRNRPPCQRRDRRRRQLQRESDGDQEGPRGAGIGTSITPDRGHRRDARARRRLGGTPCRRWTSGGESRREPALRGRGRSSEGAG
jgi:UDP-N-acetylmuramoyl-tripeptide--D-alanyl-D-alanine ligase